MSKPRPLRKQPKNLSLTVTAIKMGQRLAALDGCNFSSLVERLIRNAKPNTEAQA